MWDSYSNSKAALRKQYLKIRKSITGAQRKKATEQVVQQLLQLEVIRDAKNIAGYYAIKSELDLAEFYLQVSRQNKNILLPVRHKTSKIMKFVPWTNNILESLDVNLKTMEALLDNTRTEKKIIPDVILVPGLAFDQRLYRLGYGQGNYDATIRHLRSLYHDHNLEISTIGIGFSDQIIYELPMEKQDEPLDYVLTEKGLYSYHTDV